MLSPNDGNWIPLLPQDRQIMEITGMSEQEYRAFMREAILRNGIKPGDPVAFVDLAVIGVNLIIGIALTAIAQLLFPPKTPQSAGAPETRKVQGQDVQLSNRFTPTSGFDSVQNVVELGSTVPLVYANRQQIDGIAYGGVRVNTNLIFSQLYSVGNGQLLRAIFLVGEGSISALDFDQFAIGNNVIGNYITPNPTNSSDIPGRICLYYVPNGGRIKSADRVAGLAASKDIPGNAQLDGAADVFQVRGAGMAFGPNFCFTSTPSNQTTFGLYGHLGNNFPLKVNPIFSTEYNLSSDQDGHVVCPLNRQAKGRREKQFRRYSGRSGLTGGASNPSSVNNETVSEGAILNFQIFKETDSKGFFSVPIPSGDTGSGGDSITTLKDVAASIASRQNGYDDNLIEGELYRIGTAMAICTSRSLHVFVSKIEGDNFGSDVTGTFRVVRAGIIRKYDANAILNPTPYDGDISANAVADLRPCSKYPQIFRCAEASFSTERVGQVVELGLRSSLGININGLTNFADTIYDDNGTIKNRTESVIDNQACLDLEGDEASTVSTIDYTSGSYQGPEIQYSFFIVAYREAATNDNFVELTPLFGVRGQGGTQMYNYLRFDFGSEKRWEFRLTPVSSFEVRNGLGSRNLVVLDYRSDFVTLPPDGPVTVQCNCEQITNDNAAIERYFSAPVTRMIENVILGPDFDDNDSSGKGYYVDCYARIAEAFIYNEITSSTASQPAHSVVYINTVTANDKTPEYDNLALVGMNIRSSKEITRLDQFSVYVNKGINSTSDFPEILKDLLTNKTYGTGSVVSQKQIDLDSFTLCSDFASKRKYFFDGAIVEKINIRSWAAETAAHFLMEFAIKNGKFALQPVANFYGAEAISQLFTAGNIIKDSFSLSYLEERQRIPPRVSVRWREERQSTAVNDKGLFPVIRQVTVRESDTPEDAPFEQIDLSDFCTSQEQAIDRAKWECRQRRLVTHGVTFKTVPSEAALDIGSVFKLGLESFSYNAPSNGAIDAAGVVTSWPELADGTYSVLYWDGTTSAIAERSIVITGGKTSAGPAVFSVKTSANDTGTYRTQSLSFDDEGNLTVEASFFPTGSDGVSELARNWENDSKWIIEGNR